MGKTNAEWHQKHPMPPKATLDQRVTWHLEHQKQCGCHPGLPRTVQAELERRAKGAPGSGLRLGPRQGS